MKGRYVPKITLTCLFVVIQHSVHALNPKRVYGAIEHHPFPFWGVTWGKFSKGVCHNPICPLIKQKSTSKKSTNKQTVAFHNLMQKLSSYLMGHRIKLTKHLAHRYRFRIDSFIHNFFFFIIAPLIHQGQSISKNMKYFGFSSKWFSNKHEPMEYFNRIFNCLFQCLKQFLMDENLLVWLSNKNKWHRFQSMFCFLLLYNIIYFLQPVDHHVNVHW